MDSGLCHKYVSALGMMAILDRTERAVDMRVPFFLPLFLPLQDNGCPAFPEHKAFLPRSNGLMEFERTPKEE